MNFPLVDFSDDEEDQDDATSQFYYSFRDGLLLLIDCGEDMMEKVDDKESPFELAMKCALSVIKNKIISSERDLLSIVFYGTEKTKENSGNFKNIYVLQELDQPTAERVKEVKNILEGGVEEFKKKYGVGTYFLADAFWACAAMFSHCDQKLGSRRIMLFTNNDNPHHDDDGLQRRAKMKAEDLHQAGIELELMHMNKHGSQFDYNKFYKDCLVSSEDDDVLVADASEKFDELMRRVRSKDHQKRTMAKTTLSLGEGLDMAVGIYNMLSVCKKPSAVKLYKKNNEPVKSVSKTVLVETGEILLPQDLKKSVEYAGRKVCFEIDELTEMKRLGPPGIKLLGFKPRDKLKRYHHVRPAQFLYPEEGVVRGSTTLFSALLKKCLDRDVVPICLYAPRKTSAPKYVALLPQAEELDENKVQVTPPGFHVIFLPFADDFRALKLPETTEVSQEQVDAAKAVVRKLATRYESTFENPVLQKYYVNLEALALELDEAEKFEDHTEPDVAKQEERAGKEIQEFKSLVFPADYSPSAASGTKRGSAGGEGAAKRIKQEAGDVDVEGEARAGRLSKLTVVILKDYIKSQNIHSGTRKADLIAAINQHLGL